MNVRIEYCGVWSYEPRAVSLAAKIKAAFPGAQVQLVRGKGGDFKVDYGTVRLWDKRNMDDEFPVEASIVEQLKTLSGHR